MKKPLPLLCLVFFCASLHGQTLSPDVISTSGNYNQGFDVSLSWTMGEIMTETYNGSGCILSSGFQPYLLGVVTVIHDSKPDFELKIFPVPASQLITVQLGASMQSRLNLDLFDLNGKSLLFKRLDNGSNSIDLSFLHSAEYILQITDEEGHLIRSVKIVKY
ncbi:MAG: T9SS type A sorting domain-containing protein [Bacteroidales bacterium]|nr:T9SS type A sorting domain-containing protein [Bacteroidales bacterium]